MDERERGKSCKPSGFCGVMKDDYVNTRINCIPAKRTHKTTTTTTTTTSWRRDAREVSTGCSCAAITDHIAATTGRGVWTLRLRLHDIPRSSATRGNGKYIPTSIGSQHSVTATTEMAAISGALRRNEFRCRSRNQHGKFNDDRLTR